MSIIRDKEMNGILMIPLWSEYNLHRCNVSGCKEKQTTLVLEKAERPFAVCETHYKLFNRPEGYSCTLDFD
jgi:hypothetical protein